MMVSSIVVAVSLASQPWVVESIPSPEGETVEVGGIAFPQTDVVAVSTRRGRVWWIDSALDDDPTDARWTRYADGLYEGLGMTADAGELIVLQRGELSRLRDVDGDRLVDDIDTITQDWGLSENYHEFAFGLPRDAAGNHFVSLNLGFMSPEWWHGLSVVPYRGWILRVSPEGDVEPWAHGFRSPCGLGFDAKGRLLATDNQGDWMPSSPIFVVEKGGFHGHPNSLRWTEAFQSTEHIPDNREPPDVERVPAAIWIPYDWSRSTGNLVTDTTGGRFGPFEDQLFVAELTTGRVLRADIEDVNGTPQGAVWPFINRIGSVARVAFAPDGSLVCGMTNRGWGGLAPGHGLKRIRWNGETPLEMKHVRITSEGFDIAFTKPVSQAPPVDEIDVRTYDYNWWWKYGSPEQRVSTLQVSSARLSADGMTLHVTIPELQAGRVVRMRLSGIATPEGEPLRTEEVAYTINRLPEGPVRHVVRKVSPPPLESIDEDESGWLRLMWDDPTELWSGNWRLTKDALDPVNRSLFTDAAGNNVLVNDQTDHDLALRSPVALPVRVRASVMLPQSGSIAFGLPGGNRLVCRDMPGGGWIGVQTEGGRTLLEGDGDAWRGPGQWQEMEFRVQEGGLGEVLLDGVRVLDGLELDTASSEPWLGVLGDVGPAGVADIRVKIEASSVRPGGTSLISSSMQLTDALWGGLGTEGLMLRGAGEVPLTVTCSNRCVIDGRIRFESGTTAWLVVGDTRVAIAEGHASEPTTGSVIGAADLDVRLIPSGIWYDLEVFVDSGCVGVMLNGLLVAEECIDSTDGPMAIVLQQGGVDIAFLNLNKQTGSTD